MYRYDRLNSTFANQIRYWQTVPTKIVKLLNKALKDLQNTELPPSPHAHPFEQTVSNLCLNKMPYRTLA